MADSEIVVVGDNHSAGIWGHVSPQTIVSYDLMIANLFLNTMIQSLLSNS